LQTEALTKAGCKKIFEDKVTGSRAERPGLTKAQEALREGDTLVVWKLDRLGRSVKNLVDLVGELHKEGVQFKSLTDANSPLNEPAPDSKLPGSSVAKVAGNGK
jgi:DNA invertase Pin-like site-specific DNA recombinase